MISNATTTRQVNDGSMFVGFIMKSIQNLQAVLDSHSIEMEHVLFAIAIGALLPICLIALKYYQKSRRNRTTNVHPLQHITTTDATLIADPSRDSSEVISELLDAGISSSISQLEITEIQNTSSTPSSSLVTSHDLTSDADIESSIVSQLEPAQTHKSNKGMM